MKNFRTGIISDVRMLRHKAKYKHPESPRRVKAIIKMLREEQYLTHEQIDYVEGYERLVTDQQIKLAYPEKYLKFVKEMWPKGATKPNFNSGDTYINQHSEEAARISAGGVLLGIDKIMNNEWKNGFSIIRPPGHHSGQGSTAKGFCILNNIAIGARYLQSKYEMKKIAILDYDIHEGDGTHHIFRSDPNVLFISIHRYDRGSFYPGGKGGDFPNCGSGDAQGTKINIPLNLNNKKKRSYDFQAHGDNEYIYIYNRILHPIIKQFNPEFILVSSGFDAARKDYLGGFTVTPNTYYYITRKLNTFNKPILCVLQGGYHLISTAQSATAVVQGLIEEQMLPQPVKGISYQNIHTKCHLQKEYHQDIDEIINHHSKYWKSLIQQELIQYTEQIKKNEEKVFGVFNGQSSSSSSGQEERQQEQSTKESTKSSEVYPKQDKQQSTSLYKKFSYTSNRVLKKIHLQQGKFYFNQFPQKQFAPKYFGLEGEHMILENILYKHKQSTVIDIKLSRSSKNIHLSEEQRAREAKKEAASTSQKLYYRIAEITTPQSKEDRLLIDNQGTNKKILKKVVDSQKAKAQFGTFLEKLASELKKTNRVYYGTSIILIKGKTKYQIYWTNFYHWYNNETYDQDLVQGINNLLETVNKLDLQSKV